MPDDTPDKPLIQRILHQQPRRPFAWNIPTMTDEESPWIEDGVTIVNELDLARTTVYTVAGETIETGDELTISPEDGRLYRRTDGTILYGYAERDMHEGERVTLWPEGNGFRPQFGGRR